MYHLNFKKDGGYKETKQLVEPKSKGTDTVLQRVKKAIAHNCRLSDYQLPEALWKPTGPHMETHRTAYGSPWDCIRRPPSTPTFSHT